VILTAGQAPAQGFGMPLWNSPKGGTGLTISGDVAMPSEDYGKGTAFGARASFGLGNLTLGAGLVSWKPDGFTESYTSLAAQGALRVIGGSLMPVALNLQLGAARVNEANLDPSATRVSAGAGLSVALPTPGLSIEPYLSVSNRWTMYEGFDAESGIGWTVGANVSFGMFGFHLAYDSEDLMGVTSNTFGVGAHVALRPPMGL
jgi:hypothetical protein